MNSAELQVRAEAAVEFLHNRAEEHGIARANAEYLEEWVKVELARIKGLMVGVSDAAATAEAMRHPDYTKALQDLRTARETHYTNQFKRAAKSTIVDVWRTVCSNERANP